jgi:hypothetical protein
MPENDQAKGNPNKAENDHNNASQGDPPSQVYPIGLPIRLRPLWIVGGILLGVLLIVSIFLPNLSERVKFFTVNALSTLVLLAIVVQTYIYRRQWELMEHQALTMQASLKVLDRQTTTQEMQSRTIQDQLEVMKRQAQVSEKQSDAIQAQLAVMEAQRQAMQDQLTGMKDALTVAERNAKAAENGVKAAQDAFYLGERAYMGIIELALISPLVSGDAQTLDVTWQNGGKTPAWNFRCITELVVSIEEPTATVSFAYEDFNNASASFWPSQTIRKVEYPQAVIDQQIRRELYKSKDPDMRLWAVIRATYRDISGQIQSFYASARYDVWQQRFISFQYDYLSERVKTEPEQQKIN